ncbi:hypothetical protein FB451DRAFT_745005 [Mycena latifolia]|nr:hypothetical protein FB451DRAFT_745005 [Mycena latifolia]
MSPTQHRSVASSQAPSNRPKRMMMDCVLLQSISRPPKRKVVAPETSRSLVRDKLDDEIDNLPSPSKKTRRLQGPPGLRTAINASSTTKQSRPKTIVVEDSSSSSESEDERPPKRPRVVSRIAPKPSADLRFSKTQTAVSVADAVNNASAQNSKAIQNTARPLPSSSSGPALPRRPKRKIPPTPTALTSSSSSPVPNAASAASSTIENSLRALLPPSHTPTLPRRQPKRKVLPAPTGLTASTSSTGGPMSPPLLQAK